MTPTTRADRTKALAKTDGHDYDGWERLQEYQRVQRHRADNGDANAAAFANQSN